MLTDHVQQTVHQTILDLIAEFEDDVTSLPLSAGLSELGLNSLTLARLIILLETALGVDPFAGGAAFTDLRTVEDLVNTYQRALRVPVEV